MNFAVIKRLLVMVLCLTLITATIVAPAAYAVSYKTINKSTATFQCNTANTRFNKTSKVTFYNSSMGPLKITASASGCSVSSKEITVASGSYATFTITTAFSKVGTTTFNVVNTWGCPIVYAIDSSNVRTIVRTK